MNNNKKTTPLEIEFSLDDENNPGELDANAMANFDPLKEKEYENLMKDFHLLMHKHSITELTIIIPNAKFDGTFYRALQKGFSNGLTDDFREAILDISIPNPDYKGKIKANKLDDFPTFDENPFI